MGCVAVVTVTHLLCMRDTCSVTWADIECEESCTMHMSFTEIGHTCKGMGDAFSTTSTQAHPLCCCQILLCMEFPIEWTLLVVAEHVCEIVVHTLA